MPHNPASKQSLGTDCLAKTGLKTRPQKQSLGTELAATRRKRGVFWVKNRRVALNSVRSCGFGG